MPMKITGDKIVVASMRNIAQKVPEVARKRMHRIADAIVKDAQLFTPVDTTSLEESIHKEVTYAERGRLNIAIVAGGVVNGIDTSEYAAKIHENYESLGVGLGTVLKRALNPGVYIGEKFLERAIKKHSKRATEDIQIAVSEVLKYAAN